MALLLRGVRVLVLFVLFVFTKSGVLLYTYLYYIIHIFTYTKKNTVVIHFCVFYSDLLDVNMLSKTTKSNVYAARAC